MKIHSLILIAGGLLTGIAPLPAGPRSSANYRIPTETTDAGGGRATSASYAYDGSTGGITGVASVAAPAASLKSGYLGQLYEVTGLTLTAPSQTVNETATVQLGAALALDDATTLNLSATEVAWSVLSGSFSGISAGGLATAGAVYQNTAATAQGGHSGFTGTLGFNVLDIITDNFGTYSGDGLGDAWQMQYFGLNNPAAGPSLDPDGDGQTNQFEFIAGLVPTDPLSVFMLRIEPVPGQPAQKKLIFGPRLTDRLYTVRSSTNLAPGSWSALTGATITDQGSERTVIDPAATQPKKLYDVEIVKP